jgi:hypothetical protein
MGIANGLKKLRQIGAEKATQSVVLWRGLKNVKPSDTFVKDGGTEV